MAINSLSLRDEMRFTIILEACRPCAIMRVMQIISKTLGFFRNCASQATHGAIANTTAVQTIEALNFLARLGVQLPTYQVVSYGRDSATIHTPEKVVRISDRGNAYWVTKSFLGEKEKRSKRWRMFQMFAGPYYGSTCPNDLTHLAGILAKSMSMLARAELRRD